MIADELGKVALLAPLTGERLAALAAAGEEHRFRAGETVFREGDPATHFMFLLEGELETTRNVAGDEMVMQRHAPGGYLGAIALITETPFRGTTRAVVESRLFYLEAEAFHRLVLEEPAIRRTVFQVFVPVMQNIQGLTATREKLVALGGLAAGLAHELNNPAAAAQRLAAELERAERERTEAIARLVETGASAGVIAELGRLAAEASGAAPQDVLEASDREDALGRELSARGLAAAATLAGALVEAGFDDAVAADAESAAQGADLEAALRWLAARALVPRLHAELREAVDRIASLVGAVKQYSYMDQAPRQEVDVREGIESTLAILIHKIRRGDVRIVRSFGPDVPRIDAYGSELNQLWTNLLDNAIDAVGGDGTVTIRTALEIDRVVVEIADDGPGIPRELQGRIFEPFFTTKGVGQGTGLGLDIAQRIVLKHRGELTVESQPGETRFRVRLPVGP